MQSLIPNTTYHIFNHANGFENIFREKENYRYFLEKYRLYISPIAELLLPTAAATGRGATPSLPERVQVGSCQSERDLKSHPDWYPAGTPKSKSKCAGLILKYKT